MDNFDEEFDRALDGIRTFDSVDEDIVSLFRGLLQTSIGMAQEIGYTDQAGKTRLIANMHSVQSDLTKNRWTNATLAAKADSFGMTLLALLDQIEVIDPELRLSTTAYVRGAVERARWMASEAKARESARRAEQLIETLVSETNNSAELASASLAETKLHEESAKRAAKEAHDAAGLAGGVAQASAFSELARNERRASNFFRSVTVVGIISTILLAAAWGLAPWTDLPDRVSDAERWTRFASHASVIVALGSLSAYLGRLAGQHRRSFVWAQSVQVQIRSFPALTSPSPDSVKGALYVALANRVLAAPPEKGVEADAPGVTPAQLVEIATATIKKS